MKKIEKQEIPKKKKFNVGKWLLLSIFSIISAAFGLINLILHFVDK